MSAPDDAKPIGVQNVRQRGTGTMTEEFKKALADGCVIWPTSCTCGGNYAWLVPRPSGARMMYGCICHNPPPVKGKDYD